MRPLDDRSVREALRPRGQALLPRADLADVLRGRAPWIGSRLDRAEPRGFVSPVEARFAMGIPYGDLLRDEREALRRSTVRANAATLARAAVGQLVSKLSAANEAGDARPYVVGAPLDRLSSDEAIEAVLAPVRTPHARMVCFVHPHCLNVALTDDVHRDRLARADLVLPDGIGLRLAGGLLGAPIAHNLCGTDVIPVLLERARDRGVPVVMIGGEPGVADACATTWIESTPGLDVRIRRHGFLTSIEIEALRAELRALGDAVVLVGMGSPIQERWAFEHLRDLTRLRVLTVGGLFDYFAGRVPRAPVVWRELGLEWLFRLKQEPRRLAKRYLFGNPMFVAAAVAQRLGALPHVPPSSPRPSACGSSDPFVAGDTIAW